MQEILWGSSSTKELQNSRHVSLYQVNPAMVQWADASKKKSELSLGQMLMLTPYAQSSRAFKCLQGWLVIIYGKIQRFSFLSKSKDFFSPCSERFYPNSILSEFRMKWEFDADADDVSGEGVSLLTWDTAWGIRHQGWVWNLQNQRLFSSDETPIKKNQ